VHYIAHIKLHTNFHSDAFRHPMMSFSGSCHTTVSSQHIHMLIRMCFRLQVSWTDIDFIVHYWQHSGVAFVKIKDNLCVIRLDKNKKRTMTHFKPITIKRRNLIHFRNEPCMCQSQNHYQWHYTTVRIQISGSLCGIYTSNYQIYFEI
jgi:hypothetical protein